MKAQEIRELTEKEHLAKMDELSQEYFNLRFQLATGKIENPSRLKHIRRDIARLKTIFGESAGKKSKSADTVEETNKKG